MRFTTEYKTLVHDATDYGEYYRKKANALLGEEIASRFVYENPVNGNPLHHKLEIEAFPMDKWIEFKMALFAELQAHSVDQIKILKLIKELESFDKPSGDAITNLPDLMEYRGPSSHCKACEDEKNGVKYIMAQKHTCRK